MGTDALIWSDAEAEIHVVDPAEHGQHLTVAEIPVTMNERAGGTPSQSVFRATLYTGRILFILGLASIRSVPPQLRALRRANERASA